jgi:hypothetical protein
VLWTMALSAESRPWQLVIRSAGHPSSIPSRGCACGLILRARSFICHLAVDAMNSSINPVTALGSLARKQTIHSATRQLASAPALCMRPPPTRCVKLLLLTWMTKSVWRPRPENVRRREGAPEIPMPMRNVKGHEKPMALGFSDSALSIHWYVLVFYMVTL